MREQRFTSGRVLVTLFLLMVCIALPAFAQQSEITAKGPLVIHEFKHDTGPRLREVMPLLPEFGTPVEREIENHTVPNPFWSKEELRTRERADLVLQTAE